MGTVLLRFTLFLPAMFSACAQAQSPGDYPARPVTIIVMSATGSSVDSTTRLIADRLKDRLNQAIVVENITGASGVIGADRVAKSAPDGYTLLTAVNTLVILPGLRPDMPFDIRTDFAAITKLAKVSLTFAASNLFNAADIKDLLAQIKASPGKFTFASPGVGTPHHLTGELIKLNLGLDMVHVPHKDISLAVGNVVGGHVDMIISGTGSVLPLGNAGKLKLFATTGTKRSVFAPGLPTFYELGYDFMADTDGWNTLFAPARTPASIVTRLNREVRDILGAQEIRNALQKHGVEVETSTPEQTTAFVLKDFERWQRVIKAAKITAN